MGQNERDRACVEPVVQRIEHRSRHRHAVVGFEQRRHIRRHDRDGIATTDAAPAQRVGEPAAAIVELAIREASGTMNHG